MPRFQDILGQEHIKDYFQNAIVSNKVSHAYIINGEGESGKEYITNIIARTLQCESVHMTKGLYEPCDECVLCKQALSGNQPDIKTIIHEIGRAHV